MGQPSSYYRAKWKKLGLCTNCGTREALRGFVRCQKCLDHHKKDEREKRKNHISRGLCTRCGGINKGKTNECESCMVKKRPQARKDKLTASLRCFGASLDDYNRLYNEQGGRCAICGVHKEKAGNQESDNQNVLCADHCHRSNKLRELLCSHCNHGLGQFKDDAGLLGTAALYLMRFSGDSK